MQSSQLNRILRLVRRTGDRFVIMDKETEEVVVMMDLNEYEDLLNDASDIDDLEEEDMLNRVSHDIASWRDKKDIKDDWNEPETLEPMETIEEPLEPVESEPILEEKLVPLNQETNLGEQNLASEELNDVPHIDQTDEDEPQFLLEPVE